MMEYGRHLLVLVLLQLVSSPSHSQQTGAYPSVTSVATYRPVTADSVCGADGPEQYCQYTSDSAASSSLGLLPTCIEATCDNTCPHSTASPEPLRPASAGTLGPGVIRVQGREEGETTAFRFQRSSIEVSASFVPALGENGFTFAAWINRDAASSRGTLVSKSSSDPDSIERNYVISVEEDRLTFDYLPDTVDLAGLPEGSQRYRTVIVEGLTLPAGVWHHIAITVYAEDAAVYVNGTVEGVQALEGRMVDTSRTLLLGATSDGIGSYSGLMEDMYMYTQALTVREVQELFEGSFPFSHLSTECHCPPSHPVINLDDEMKCIQHSGGGLISRGVSNRINSSAHPPGFVNDLSIAESNGWISSPGHRQVNITLNLTNSLYELIFINFRFGSPRFKAAVLETSRDGGVTFEPIQYFADDCMSYFSLPNDGAITDADGVNCITSQSLQTPTYGVDVRTRLLDPQTRPFDLNSSPELREFILSSHLQLRLVDLFTESTTLQHQYYSILEITVAARCACNGHSSRCGSSIDSVCECAHNTEGDTCDRCLPFYNDKPWRYGETDNAYPCKKCDCNGHATSCHYNATFDPFPDSYDQGGGGMCENCQHNTAGRHCEDCAFAFYRPPGVSANDSNPCTPCNCDMRGDTNSGDCVKSEGISGQVVGQCQCKSNVIGTQCDQCRDGFFALSASNPQGCSPCNCNTDGTVVASATCHATSGQCQCKENVMGLKCDQCINGTTGLSALNENGCSPCSCNIDGSRSTTCDRVTGACECKPGVGGTHCDQCLDGYFGFSDQGCRPCTCNTNGAVSNVCDKDTGSCTCRPNIEGGFCDTCSNGYYDLSASCVECGCNTDGTVNSNVSCLEDSGQCMCKMNVEGRICDTCKSGFTILTAANIVGCGVCNCSEFGTDRNGSICDPITSQCECLPSATGYRCDDCVPGFQATAEGCTECDCDPDGSSSNVCDISSGDCPCNEGVGGERCDFCRSGFFQFPSCQACDCERSGTVECDVTTGVCNCKMFVSGDACNVCRPGFQLLDADNPFGCTAAPDEQAPPTASVRSSTYIELTWLLPEAPNGVIIGYQLYRNSSNIADLTERMYNDTGLTPNSYYSYSIESYNIIGSTTSTQVVFKTLEGIPTGLSPPTYQVLNSTAVNVLWTEPMVSHGTISNYVLLLVQTDAENEEVFQGNSFFYVVTNLRPSTTYSFIVQACTTGGCGSSSSSQVQTAQAPPTSQPAPTVTALSDTELQLQWDAPPEPNGIIVRYDFFQREDPFEGDGVFVSSVDGRDTLSLVVARLEPFTRYQFRVESHTEAGGTSSEWSEGMTLEAAPSNVDPPTVTALSATTLQVTWTEPTTPNGHIVIYYLYSTSDGGTVDSLLTNASLSGSFVVNGLEPFTVYGFIVEVCTTAGCTRSGVGSGLTGESAPTGQSDPILTNISSTSVHLAWEAPDQPNGVISNYLVHRRAPSLLPTPAQNDVGTSFTGNGYATFVPSQPSNFENIITLSFRTLDCCGVIFYSINTAETDLLAIELRGGVPWFVFDAGTGSGAIKPEGDMTFNDGNWHTLTVTQRGNTGTITVDNIYSGSGTSLGSSTVVGYVVHYIGGIPPDAPLQTLNGGVDSSSILSGQSFAGCLYNVIINDITLDFSTGFPGVGGPDQGCPIDIVPTAQLLGGGYFALEDDIITGNRFNISFQFRTTHTDGLLFSLSVENSFMFGIELRSSSIHFVLLEDSPTILETPDQPCGGEWHHITISQEEQNFMLTVDATSRSFTLTGPAVTASSRVFFGGIPRDSDEFELAQNAGLDPYTPFSGCIRLPEPFLYVASQPTTASIAESELVNFDGCSNAPGASCVAPWYELNAGSDRRITDTDLTPFSAYLYRVVTVNTAGSAYSSWQSTNTEQSAPTDVGSVTLSTATSTSLSLTWSMPETPNGRITQYNIQATPSAPIEGHTGATVMLPITEPEQTLTAALDNLLPFTSYSVILSVATVAGTGSGPAITLTTREAAPEGVQPVYVTEFGSRSLTLSWNPPTQPNGIITEYNLFVNGIRQFSGLARTATVGNLLPSTFYRFLIEACTSVGCTNSSESGNTTLPDKPEGLAPPSVTPLSPSSLEITWEEPEISNGEILHYELQQLTTDRNITLFSGVGFSYELTDLTPNTVYRFRVFATNAGGTTASDVAQNRTLEDAPDGLSSPVLTAINATAINVTWEEPSQPNGVISEYILFRNGTEVFHGLKRTYTDTNLNPFTFYSYSIQACTSGNCSASTPTITWTDEATPEGLVPFTITMITSDTFTLTLNEVLRPNGIVLYIITVMGEFADGADETRVVYNGTEVGTVVVRGLLPSTIYQITQTVSNSAGFLTGDVERVTTDPAAPEGLMPPNLSLLNATTLEVSWSAPEQPNDNITRYELTISNGTTTPLTLDQGTDTSTVVYSLRPYTNYTVQVTAYNTVGNTSAANSIQTGETAPSGFDEVLVEQRGPRSILFSWDEPAVPNGVLITYTVLLEGEEEIANISPPTIEYNVTGLAPFTEYQFSVLACTSAGCVESPLVTTMTLEDAPEGVPAPNVDNGVMGQVFVIWGAPSHPNGIITRYIVERAQNGEDYIQVHSLTADLLRVFGDLSVDPYTEYRYRIVAVNSAGSATGLASTILTPEAAPEGVLPPVLNVLSSSAIEVAFQPPHTPNGELVSYSLIRRSPTSTQATDVSLNVSALPTINGSFIYKDTTLSPFTNYTYSLIVCTSAVDGCTSSDGVSATTDEATPSGLRAPSVSTVSESSVIVSWEAPVQPNGIIESYIILQRSFGFEVSAVVDLLPNCCEDYLSANGTVVGDGCSRVVQLNAATLNFLVTALQPYSNYRYCIIVSNSAGATFSPTSNITQTAAALMPTTGPSLTASTVNSTAIYLFWSSLDISQLLGPFRGYTLYGSEAGQQPQVLFSGNAEEFTATDLIASTEYTFSVLVSNGRGSAFSNNASATTEEGIPANLSAPRVRAIGATSIYITWSEPNEPNGVIISYTIFLNSVEYYNQSTPGELTIEDLSPFTLYTVRVEACTRFGCTRSPQVQVVTLEGAPVGLASPTVQITGPTSANISWVPPTETNGIITNYQLFQREGGINGQPALVLSELTFQYTATDLRPFTMYGYEVYAINGGGNVSSGVTISTTDEARPTFIDASTVTVISATAIQLGWVEPEELNGVFRGYNVYRNSIEIQSGVLFTEYTDLNLDPFSHYSYVIEACTNAGCTPSVPVSNTTLEAIPEMVGVPIFSNIQARSLVVSWEAPGQQNGIITQYILYQITDTENATVLSDNLDQTFSLSDLIPFTTYSFYVDTCNSAGCTQSATASATTLQAPPEGVIAPMLRDLTSTSAHIEWLPPGFPNGVITSYTIRRGTETTDSVVVFEGIAFSYDDTDLIANTLYSYTVTATNEGGSNESAPSYIQTVTDLIGGVYPPSVRVLGPRSLTVTWIPPEFPNGDISLYILYMDNVAVFSGIGFEYSRNDLTPYTEYSFYYEVFNQVGPSGSTVVTNRTDAAPPEGLAPPTLQVLGSSAIRVEWQPPTSPNGVIARYRVRRRLFNNPPTEFIHFVTDDPTTRVFQNSGLEPFTRYEYRLEVFNQAGSTLSDFSDAITHEDIPQGVIAPSISSIFARNVTATWSAPLQPNGIIMGYRLEYRLLLDSSTSLPGEIVIAAETPASVTSATAMNLTPVTTYEFRVAAVNGAGSGYSEWEVATTAEDVPEGITEITVESRTSSSLTLTWGTPANPNGEIREYILLLDGEIEHQTQLTMYQITRLQPFTTYSLQLGACTSAGCTYGSIQFVGTDEATPVGQAAPSATALGPRRVEILWEPPSQANGIIILYEILRQESDSGLITVLSTSDTGTLEYVDRTVLPATTYGYAIAANNSAGQVVSDYKTLTTPEAAPEGISVPTVLVTSSSSIDVSWNAPLQPNGVISRYQVFRDGGGQLNESVYIGQNRQFTDTNLDPFTQYTYTLQACTSGGCGFSASVTNTTLEALPQDFNSVQASPLTSTSIRVEWREPLSPNGIILRYKVVVSDGVSSIEIVITDLNTDVTNLRPYTNYTVTVDACNSVGCVSGTALVTTLESIPQFVAPPILQALSPTSVYAQWQEPAQPNGAIVTYILRRDGLTVFEGNTLQYNDTNLLPNRGYTYTVQAFTAVGGSEQSPSLFIQTPPDTPEDISPPSLTVLGADSILVEWSVPGRPNGRIQSYILSVNGTVVFEGLTAFELTVDELAPFTVYKFRLDVCTTTCGNSSSVTEQTGEATPTGQAPPTLATFQNTTVLVTWEPPSEPNGIIISFELRRRLISESDYNLVYSGLDLEFQDNGEDLQPAMVYEYDVTSANSVDSVTSDSNSITLPDAPPEGIPTHNIIDVTSTALTVSVSPPAVPNGQLTSYVLYQNGSVVFEETPTGQGSGIEFSVDGLQPYTVYVYRVEVCTVRGCGSSDDVIIRTAEDVPQSYDIPSVGVALSARSILVSWSPPSQPNGLITSYTLWFQLACPQPEQPELGTPAPQCIEDRPLTRVTTTDQTQFTVTGTSMTDPFPYSRYRFLVEARNSVGAVNSTFSLPVETQTSVPEVKQDIEFNANQTTGIVNLNWESAFRSNGPVQRYTLTRNGIALLSRQTTSVVLLNEPRDTDLAYIVTILTSVGEASTDPVTLRLRELITDPSDGPTISATSDSSDDGTRYYKEAAFITGMVILGVCLLFIVGAVFLCFVRPLGDPGFLPGSPQSISTRLDTPTKHGSPVNHLDTSSKRSNTTKRNRNSRGTMAGSWTPGQPIWEELPDMGEEDGLLATPRKQRSYSPRGEEKVRLLEEEVLPDTHISGYASGSIQRQGPHCTTSADEDFGTFRASQTTFADTKV